MKKIFFSIVILATFFINVATAQLIPLVQLWNGQRADNFLAANNNGAGFAQQISYELVRTEGYASTTGGAGLKPMTLLWNDRNDNFTTATESRIQHAVGVGYKNVGVQCYIWENPGEGLIPLKLFWSGDRIDNYTTASRQGEADALAAGYVYAGIEGYIKESAPVMTRFVPSVHGFKFYNDFTTTVAGIDFRGLCGGMAYSALDYFNSGLPIPSETTPPPDGTILRNYIFNRQQNSTLDNLDKWGELTINPFGSRTQEFFNWGIQGYNGGRLEELKNEINAGKPVPLGLYKGGNGGFVTHHQVLAIGYDTGSYNGRFGEGANQVKIFIYDSNFPNRMMTLVPNLGNQTYYYLEDRSCSWLTYFVDRKYRASTPPRLP